MLDNTRGERLLETARDVLRDELLPALPAHQRHAALMVAHAMAIAARELNRCDDAGLNEARAAKDRQLCASIRAGGVDAGTAAAQVHAELLASTRARVELSNPKFLQKKPSFRGE
ncbi:DUF6285 domain-containing protein [Aquabacterium sp.]|uniref:DUF6285 domain-containing protein n=1 Tax=Aquabacterium sp. TaxID=1872578 RepID=UPI002D021FCD|nr:DUF6285 domain-containing protein [Aquabacterium sp.]HSW06298.1 DUF6285 domain-containing protein [Aquabacterium sp.]